MIEALAGHGRTPRLFRYLPEADGISEAQWQGDSDDCGSPACPEPKSETRLSCSRSEPTIIRACARPHPGAGSAFEPFLGASEGQGDRR